MMRLVFFKGKGFISRAIRWQTRSAYSHVGLEIDGILYESYHRGGVRKDRKIPRYDVDFYRLNLGNSGMAVMTTDQAKIVKAFLESKIGMGYDFMMVARFLSRRPATVNDKYFCSELLMEAFNAANICLLNAASHYVSPRDLSMSPLIRKE